MTDVPDISVAVVYSPIKKLGTNQIEYNGAVFDCNGCSWVGCCGDDTASATKAQCYKCACQAKGDTKCSLSGTCDTLSPHCCVCTDKINNQTLYDPQTSKVFLCQDALALIADPNQATTVMNIDEINTVCTAPTRLNCCKGIGTSDLCGGYWGPSNTTGDCDAIMNTYCLASPTDPSCGCLQSDLPVPECIDKRCAQTTAFKTLAMNTNRKAGCNATFQICNQYVTISSGAANNIIENSTISQQCSQMNNKQTSVATSSAPPDPVSQRTNLILIVIFISVGIVLAIVVGYLLYKKFHK